MNMDQAKSYYFVRADGLMVQVTAFTCKMIKGKRVSLYGCDDGHLRMINGKTVRKDKTGKLHLVRETTLPERHRRHMSEDLRAMAHKLTEKYERLQYVSEEKYAIRNY